MKPLIWKEAVETILPALPLVVGACVLAIAAINADEALLRRSEDPLLAMLGCAGGIGVIHGYLRFAVEDWNRGWPFLLHRGTGRRGAFFAKIATGLATVALGTVGVALVYAAFQWISSPLAPVLQWDRIGEYAALSTFGASAYAAGVLAAQVRRSVVAVLALLFAMPLGLVAPTIALATRGDAVPFLLFQFIAAVVLLAVAWHLFRGYVDQDLPLPARAHAALALSGGMLFVLSIALGIAWVQAGLLEELLDRQPRIVRDQTSGEIRAVPRDEKLSTSHNRGVLTFRSEPRRGSDEPGRQYDSLYPFDSYARAVDSHLGWKERWTELYITPPGVFAYVAANGGFRPRAFFDKSDGDIHLVYTSVPEMFWDGERAVPLPDLVLPEELPFERVLKKPSGARLSPATTVLKAGASLCLADPSDRSLWKLDPTNPEHALRAVELPAGDSFVALEPLLSRAMLVNGIRSRATWLVIGERGRYVWRAAEWIPSADDGFVAYEPGQEDGFATESESAGIVERRVVVVDSDAIEPAVEVRDVRSGALLFSQRYSADGFARALLAPLLYAGTLLRTPLVNAASYLSPAPERSLRGWKTPLFEPLFAGRSRPLLLALHLALTAYWTTLAWRRLRCRRAAASVIAVSTAFVIVFGLAGYVLHKLLEPRAARAAPAAQPLAQPVRELRLESA